MLALALLKHAVTDALTWLQAMVSVTAAGLTTLVRFTGIGRRQAGSWRPFGVAGVAEDLSDLADVGMPVHAG